MDRVKERKKDFLWIILFLIVFLNGFEAGGYQASLWSVGKDFDLSATKMGLYASMELFATMLAPILLGRWADTVRKDKSICTLLALQFAASLSILFTRSNILFLLSIFFLGITTSALQFIAIAALADTYPLTRGKKIAYMTSMYAVGALISPQVVDFYLRNGLSWRTLFGVLAAGSLISFAGMVYSGSDPREEKPTSEDEKGSGTFVLSVILLLSVIMCIYVGFENGFTFFVDTLFTDVFAVSSGKLALSLFWAVMIPSRILVGRYSRYAERILITSILAIPASMFVIYSVSNPTIVLLMCIPLGFASGAIYPSVLTLALPYSGKNTATATGIITAATGIGGVVFTALTGYMADQFGLQTAMMILVSFFFFSLLAALAVVRRNRKA
ncbi:MAG: MFS transporter [Solobacterium sp.]|nr:MFS transporter [Solobacterium sp.]